MNTPSYHLHDIKSLQTDALDLLGIFRGLLGRKYRNSQIMYELLLQHPGKKIKNAAIIGLKSDLCLCAMRRRGRDTVKFFQLSYLLNN